MAVCKFSILFIFLFLHLPCTFSLSFNLPTIGTKDANRPIITNGSAYISDQGIQVTPHERNTALVRKAGRATYFEPLHLWDKNSGNLTDFSTHFSFVIDSGGNRDFPSCIPEGAAGGGLGLADDLLPGQFVAVEFDTFPNYYDRPGTHVGINVNTMKSVANISWSNRIAQGMENDAWISYNASLKTLNVAFTSFTSISNNISQIQNLSCVVDLREYLPEYVTFGFSAATGDLFEKNNVKSWQFLSLPLDLSSKSPSPSPQPDSNIVITGGKKNNKGLVVGLSIGVSILVLGLGLVGYVLWRKYKKKKGDEHFHDLSMDNEFEKGSGPKRFSYNDLAWATNNFAEEEKLGEGGFGGVYKGFLRELNSHIAVKRVAKGSKQGLKEYASEMKIISLLRHKNLVQLIGWCHERGEFLLVYEFLPNGSLDFHLYKEKSVLPWEVRYKIAQGLASALLYLHEEWEQCVVHRDIKSSNIMLDSNFKAKLELPILPSMMPVPTYFPPITNMGSTAQGTNEHQSASYSYTTNSSNITTSSAASSQSAALLHTY
ncbi:L-type lectin-domain containing receptor kinase IX.1 [Forsythia ovata]|uniref:non-specific serine/threonine protein kinase n=1 Tax=Forsythia ovata TaxID=205694 RepID=A0ABD1TLI9_9LAMI